MDGTYYLHNWVECNKCFKQFILIIIVSFVLFFQKRTQTRIKQKMVCLKLALYVRKCLKFCFEIHERTTYMYTNPGRISVILELYKHLEAFSLPSHFLQKPNYQWKRSRKG